MDTVDASDYACCAPKSISQQLHLKLYPFLLSRSVKYSLLRWAKRLGSWGAQHLLSRGSVVIGTSSLSDPRRPRTEPDTPLLLPADSTISAV